MICLKFLKLNPKTYTYETANYFGRGEGNLKLGILIIKSYSHRIDEIATDLSNTFGT